MSENEIFKQTNVDLYHILNLSPGETDQVIIKRNFSDLIKIFHSDKGGKSEFHSTLVEAYKILSHPGKKFIYDNFGIAGVYLIKEDHESLKILDFLVKNSDADKNDIKLVKAYIIKKILRKINRKISNAEENTKIYSDVIDSYKTSTMDYINKKYYYKSLDDVAIMRYIEHQKFNLSTNINLLSSNTREISMDVNYDLNHETLELEEEYALNLTNKLFYPRDIKLFDLNFIDTEHTITLSNSHTSYDITLNQNYHINNFLYKEYLSLFMQPNLNLDGLSDFWLGLAFNPTRQHIVKAKFDLKNHNLNLLYIFKPRSGDRITTNMTIGKKRYNLSLTYFKNEDRKHSTSRAINLRANNLTLTNAFLVHRKSFSIEFKTSLNFGYSKQFKYNAILSIGIKFGLFKIELPIIVSKQNSIFSNSVLFLSTLIGNLVLKASKRWKRYKSNHLLVFNRVNFQRLLQFNQDNQVEAMRKAELEQENRGIVITHAYFGEFNHIYSIYKNILIFGRYNNDDPKIFDVKTALTLNILEGRLHLPLNLLDIQGVFNPDFYHTNNLGLVVSYKYNSNSFVFITKNNVSEVELPEQ